MAELPDLGGASGCGFTLLNGTHVHFLKPSADAKMQEVSLLAWSHSLDSWICWAVVAPWCGLLK